MKLTEITDDEPIIVSLLTTILKKGGKVRVDFHFSKDDPYDRFRGLLNSIGRSHSSTTYLISVSRDGDDEHDEPNLLHMGSSALDRLELKQSSTEQNTWGLTYEAH